MLIPSRSHWGARSWAWRFGALASLALSICCKAGTSTAPSSAGGINTDNALFALTTQTEPFGSYMPFPALAGDASGILSGSSAHQPRIRVRMNAKAFAALRDGRLPSGATFPNGSIVFKEVLSTSGVANLYAIMYKDSSSSAARNGWLWAEYRPDGRTEYSLNNRGGACIACHSLDEGPRNDFVRSFERQLR